MFGLNIIMSGIKKNTKGLLDLELKVARIERHHTDLDIQLRLSDRKFKSLCDHLGLKAYSDEHGDWVFISTEDK